MLKQICNLRPYSWVDLFLLGFVAKFSIIKHLVFGVRDIFMILGLLFLWLFFQLVLEFRHNYSYRGKSNVFISIFFLVIAFIIGIYFNLGTIIFTLLSTIFVIIYLFKNKNKVLGNLSSVIRGLIQSSYFFYALLFYTNSIKHIHIIIGIVLVLAYTTRALVGDIRDVKHNKEQGKKTFAVNYGIKLTIILIEVLLLAVILLVLHYFNLLVTIPLVFFCIILIFYRNGYILHQLMIMITSFVSINIVIYFTDNNLFFISVVFIGLFLNIVFYPLLPRRSNPGFK